MRALSRNTRRATAVTLAAALVIAVYLNWQYARSDVPTELPDNAAMVAAEAEDVPVQAQTVLDELPTEAEAVSSANKNYGEAQLVSVASDSGAKFFEQARLKRQKAHDEAMDSIKKTMKSSSLSAEEKKEYTAQMTANLEDLNAENEIETLIKAKGFADCLCFLQSGRADLTVMTSGEPLTAAQVAQIRDVVLNKSTVTAQNWQYARSDVPTELPDNAAMVAAEAEDVPVQAQTVLDELPTEAEAVSSANKNYGEAQLVSVASDSGAKFFEQARLKRQKAHDEAMDSIKKTMKSSSLSAEEKKEYTAQMTANLEDLNAENEIETLIKAKGFADCLCFLQSGRADLTVMTSGEPLTAAQVAQIRDVVLNKSTVTAQNITVVEVK